MNIRAADLDVEPKRAMRTVVYLCYGDGPQVQETIFSLLSAFRLSPPVEGRLQYVVYAENPHAFMGLDVRIRRLERQELDAWLGDADYIHRRKTMTIIDALSRYPGSIAFVDCDTYFLRPPEDLFKLISPGRTCLHLKEARLLESGTVIDRALSNMVRMARFTDLEGRPFEISQNAVMWNSGVVGLHSDDARLMDETLHLMDQFSRAVEQLDLKSQGYKVHHFEQFAAGLVLERATVSEARDIVFHYWPENLRLPFRKELSGLLAQTEGMPSRERADRLYPHRPQADLGRKVKQGLRRSLRSVGIPVPGMSASA